MKNVNNLTTHRSNRKLSENPRYTRSNSTSSGSEVEKQRNSISGSETERPRNSVSGSEMHRLFLHACSDKVEKTAKAYSGRGVEESKYKTGGNEIQEELKGNVQ